MTHRFLLPAYIFDWPEMCSLTAEEQVTFLQLCCEYFFRDQAMTIEKAKSVCREHYAKILKSGLVTIDEDLEQIVIWFMDDQWSFTHRATYLDDKNY